MSSPEATQDITLQQVSTQSPPVASASQVMQFDSPYSKPEARAGDGPARQIALVCVVASLFKEGHELTSIET